MSSSVNIQNFDAPLGVEIFDDTELALLSRMARKGAFEICLQAGHGHIGGCSAAAELMIGLYFGGALKFCPSNPNDPRRDRVLLRGHLGPLRYKLFSWLDWLSEGELGSYRRLGSRLHGHEDHLHTPGVDITPSGSLGMVLSYGVGCAAASREIGAPFRTWVFLGDGEEQEGVVSEAARHAAHLRVGNLIAIIDRNGKQLSNPVSRHDSSDLAKIWDGYGWHVETLVDGNDISQVRKTLTLASERAAMHHSPCLIIANTVKGLGLVGAEEHYSGFHTITRTSTAVVQAGIDLISSTIDSNLAKSIYEKLSMVAARRVHPTAIPSWKPIDLTIKSSLNTPNNPDICQKDYFQQLGASPSAADLKRDGHYFLTADVTTLEAEKDLRVQDTFSYYNVGLREQHMIAMAHGISVAQPSARVLINSLDAFAFRSLDQLHAASQGRSSFVVLGDVSGLTNSRNGRTHQPTGLPTVLATFEGLTFLEPWDAEDTFSCLNWALGRSRGIVYIRLHSSLVDRLTEAFPQRAISYYPVIDGGSEPNLVMVGSGLTINGCVKAAPDYAPS